MKSLKPLILTMGDPTGIGPEITQKAWQILRTDTAHQFALVGSPNLYEQVPIKVISDLNAVPDIFAHALPVVPMDVSAPVITGQPDPRHATAILASIEKATHYVCTAQAEALVTNPIAKNILYQAGFTYPGHTEFLRTLLPSTPAGVALSSPVMMLTGAGLHIALVTIHQPLKTISQCLTKDMIIHTARLFDRALRCDFAITAPYLALCGLNPHAGEGGQLGAEEQTIINPAATELRNQGINITDAQAADSLFSPIGRKKYDGFIALYHDQGLIPIKTLDFDGGVNVTLGLPIIRTSPDHGTAFDIAGKNRARANSLVCAIKTARQIVNNRHTHG